MMMRLSKFDTSRENSEREKKKRHKNASVCLSRQKRSLILFLHILGPSSKQEDVWKEKKTRDGKNQQPLYIFARRMFPFETEEKEKFLTVRTVDQFRLKNWPQNRSKIFCNFFSPFTLLLSKKRSRTKSNRSRRKRETRDRVLSKEFISSLHA